MTQYDVIVIGGGPAGMMAAGKASEPGKSVLLLDKNTRLGRKLLITGKGRCNITNNCDRNEFIQNVPTNAKFLYSAITRFTTHDTIDFFEEHGLAVKTERGNRVFPVSDKAADVCAAMENYCKAEIKTARVSGIVREADGFTVNCEGGGSFCSTSVVLATGGKSYPLTGSNGDGYKLAASLGHTVTPIVPSLVPVVSNDEWCADMQGLSLKNVEMKLKDNCTGKILYSELGEMLFTHFGVSGPLVLSASAHIRPFEPNRYVMMIDLKPGLTMEQLDARLLRDFEKNINRDYVNSLDELLPRKMIPIVVTRSGIPALTKVNQITREQRTALCELLKGFSVSVDGFRPIDEAIVTSGGVIVTEINPKTMESKLVDGLYFAGEIIDVDGYTGGFNLQIAFSTGFVAGENC